MASEPDYSLRRDRSHACAVPWTDGDAYAAKHWRCPECGRWWERTWELAGDQPPVDYDLLLRRAGIAPSGEIELKRQRIVHSEAPGCLDYVLWIPGEAPGDRGWPMIVYLHGGQSGGHPSCPARGGLPKQIELGFTVPWVVVSPHCPNLPHPNRYNWSEYPDEVVSVIDEVRRRYPVDDTAILLTGAKHGRVRGL